MMMRPLFSLLSPAGPNGRLTTLIFHRVHLEPDPLLPDSVHARQFDALLDWLDDWFTVLPLDEAVQRMYAGVLPARALAITFDDGYADNHDVALPILQRHRMPATFFIATGFLNGGRMWNDTLIEAIRHTQHTELDIGRVLGEASEIVSLSGWAARRSGVHRVIMRAKYLQPVQRQQFVDRVAEVLDVELASAGAMMTDDQVRGLHRSGMQIGAHTVSHPILAGLLPSQVLQEVAGSRAALEDIIGARVGLFAYPNGKPGKDFDLQSIASVRKLGFDAAFTTVPGVATAEVDPLQIPRYTPWEPGRLRFGLGLARKLWDARSNNWQPEGRLRETDQ